MANKQDGCQHSGFRAAATSYAGGRGHTIVTDANSLAIGSAGVRSPRSVRTRSNRARRNLSHRVGQTYLVTLTALAAGMNPARCVRADQFVMNPGARRSISRSTRQCLSRLNGVATVAIPLHLRWVDENPNSSTAAISPRGEESV